MQVQNGERTKGGRVEVAAETVREGEAESAVAERGR
jgi:hypothetical protein